MPTPVLMVTHDDALWRRWSVLDAGRFSPARAGSLNALAGWRERGFSLVVLDTDTLDPRAHDWDDGDWLAMLAGVRLVVASPRPDDDEATRALAAGARGYCHAYAPLVTLEQVLDVVAADGIWMGRSLVNRLLQLIDRRLPATGDWARTLTPREQAVARRAAIGHANQEIALALGITERTVKAHLSTVFAKLGVADRLQLALRVHGVERKRDVA